MFLNTDDDIIVINPQHEHFGIAERLDGQMAQEYLKRFRKQAVMENL